MISLPSEVRLFDDPSSWRILSIVMLALGSSIVILSGEFSRIAKGPPNFVFLCGTLIMALGLLFYCRNRRLPIVVLCVDAMGLRMLAKPRLGEKPRPQYVMIPWRAISEFQIHGGSETGYELEPQVAHNIPVQEIRGARFTQAKAKRGMRNFQEIRCPISSFESYADSNRHMEEVLRAMGKLGFNKA
jgi:hypothetical protein